MTYWCGQQGLSMCWFWWEIIGVLNWKLLCAQLDIIGVHIVVGVNNIPNVRPAVIWMPFKSTLPHEFDVWFLHGRSAWIEEFVSLWIDVTGPGIGKLKWSASEVFCCTTKTCNGAWDWKPETEHSEVRFFVILWKQGMGIASETPKLSTAIWAFSKVLQRAFNKLNCRIKINS